MGEGETRQGQGENRRRWPVSEAAEVLGITVDALRSRIKREAIDHVREGGRVYVLLDAGQGTASQGQGETSQGQGTASQGQGETSQGQGTASQGQGETSQGQGTASQGQGETSQGQDTGQDYRDALIDTLREQLAEERNANRENRRLLAAALERIPAIEAPEPRDAPETSTEGETDRDTPDRDTNEPRASLWRRWFG